MTHVIPKQQTVTWASWVYGEEGVALDDPAEHFHEASAISPNVVDHRVPGRQFLQHERLQVSTVRAVKRHPHLPTVPLPPPTLPPESYSQLVARRGSQRAFARGTVSLEQVSTLLQTAYGVNRASVDGRPLRAVPSGGALYPLELYPVASNVDGLEPAVYHFDPLAAQLERLHELREGRSALGALTVYPELLTESAVIFFVTAVFWRTRFKYGQRGYRFALLEAGHLGQNLLLSAEALGLAAVPVGGFYDRLVNRFLGVDGVHEAAVYAFSVGPRVDAS